MAQENFSIFQQTNFISKLLLRKNIFMCKENRASPKPNNLKIKLFVAMRSFLANNYYYVHNLLVNINFAINYEDYM